MTEFTPEERTLITYALRARAADWATRAAELPPGSGRLNAQRERDRANELAERMSSSPLNGRTYTAPEVLTTGVTEGWADPETDPTRIDWTTRQARAAIPFKVIDGRPVNPREYTGIRHGRNQLGHWGEALAADALVSATDFDGHRWIVMVERDDDHGWAIPGGHVDPGEMPVAAAARELEEETSLTVPDDTCWQATDPRYVPDPRASDEAWMVTVLAKVNLGTLRWRDFPTVTGADDARRAEWILADDYDTLTGHLAEMYGGRVFAAHVDMLTEALGRAGVRGER